MQSQRLLGSFYFQHGQAAEQDLGFAFLYTMAVVAVIGLQPKNLSGIVYSNSVSLTKCKWRDADRSHSLRWPMLL